MHFILIPNFFCIKYRKPLRITHLNQDKLLKKGVVILEEITVILSAELGRLIDDYYKCPHAHLREQIQSDIQLLNEALMQCEEPM